MTNVAKLPTATPTLAIDKGIPIPPSHRGNTRYPWTKAEVGDSFLLNNKSQQNASANVRTANLRFAPRKFTYRKTSEGFRCWRIA